MVRQRRRKELNNPASISANVVDTLPMLPTGIDALDARLIRAMCDTPRAGVMELARQLGVARGTVQARLDKLQQRGIISGFDPDLDLRAMGYEVLAFVSLEIAQGRLDDVCEHLREIPEVLEIHSVTGPGDLMCRVVAHTNDHLQHVISRVLEVKGISRTTTQIALTEQLRHRVLPLVELAIDDERTHLPSGPTGVASGPSAAEAS
jgi:DNA-binding Lrp family transcriptional regulator